MVPFASDAAFWHIGPRWGLGAEGLYGFMDAQNGDDSGDVFRFQISMFYSNFD